MNKPSVSVAISAYNAEKNIKRLLESLLDQKQISYGIKNIIVHSDASTDRTVKIAQEIKNNLIKIINSNERTGYAGSLIKLAKSNDADILVSLNDDIIITDKLFLEKIVRPFLNEDKIGLVCGNGQPIKSKNFIAEAVRTGYIPYKKISECTRGGVNVFTVDGKALCFSKKFLKSIIFPKNYKRMGNVDKYMYFSCIKNKFKYRYVFNAKMYFRCPSSVKDFISWQVRNYKSHTYIVKKTWGKLVDQEYKISKIKFRYFKLLEFLRNPLGSILILSLGFYCSYKARLTQNEFEPKWELVTSTK